MQKNKLKNYLIILLILLITPIMFSFSKYVTSKDVVNINLNIIPDRSNILVSGIEINHYMKGLSYTEPEGDRTNYFSKDETRTKDETTTSIVFGKKSNYSGIVNSYKGIAVDIDKTGSIMLYRVQNSDGSTYTVYILSDSGKIIANSDTAWMFEKLVVLTNITNLPILDTSNSKTMRDMFSDCQNLASLDLSKFDTNKVTNMQGLFARMHKMKYFDLTSFDISNVTTIKYMFLDNFILETIYVSEDWSLPSTATGARVFENCDNLVGEKGTVFDAEYADYTMAHIDGGTSNPGYLSIMTNQTYELSTGTYVNYIMKACTNDQITSGSKYSDSTVSTVTFGKINDYSSVISGITGVPVDLEKKGYINVYRVPNGNKYDVYILSIKGTFIANQDSSRFFDGLNQVTSIVNLSKLDTGNVTAMNDMFCDCSNLQSVDLTNLNTAKVTNMQGIFARVYTMEEYDLSSFDVSNVTNFKYMFLNNTALKTIYVKGNWIFSDNISTSANMFNGCTNLVGGNGTTYNSNYRDHTYARIDTSSTPGYFTKK